MARTGCVNFGSLRVVEMIVVWPVSKPSPVVTKTIKERVLLCAAILELLDICESIKQAPNIIQDRIETPKNAVF